MFAIFAKPVSPMLLLERSSVDVQVDAALGQEIGLLQKPLAELDRALVRHPAMLQHDGQSRGIRSYIVDSQGFSPRLLSRLGPSVRL